MMLSGMWYGNNRPRDKMKCDTIFFLPRDSLHGALPFLVHREVGVNFLVQQARQLQTHPVIFPRADTAPLGTFGIASLGYFNLFVTWIISASNVP